MLLLFAFTVIMFATKGFITAYVSTDGSRNIFIELLYATIPLWMHQNPKIGLMSLGTLLIGSCIQASK